MRRAAALALALLALATARPVLADDADDAQARYDQSFVAFHDGPSFDGGAWESFAYQGKYQRPLVDTGDFLDAVDRSDEAQAYRHATAIKRGLSLPGSLLLVAGGATAVAAGTMWGLRASCSNAEQTMGVCDTSAAQTATWVGVGAAAVGLVLDVAAALVPRHEVPTYEMRRLADEHNQRLRRRLGLVSLGPGGIVTRF